jgi:hypothetical protein
MMWMVRKKENVEIDRDKLRFHEPRCLQQERSQRLALNHSNNLEKELAFHNGQICRNQTIPWPLANSVGIWDFIGISDQSATDQLTSIGQNVRLPWDGRSGEQRGAYRNGKSKVKRYL